ncbi:hypothetical protein JCM19231_2033 [Vibrio ishigakensis]|uniref:Uncharacterized protein n=1 Tax=Vibrio ishigakensis TaxID=1481914 RepID=A0A0B8NQL8_9VIBR|nr:hypothetical protein JCM19231_2033 [Vibrio ishigakensis]
MTSNNLTAADIQCYLHEMGLSPLANEHYEAVITLIAEDSQNRRTLTDESLERIRSHIKTVPSGRQRKQKIALDHILLYLQNVCQWQLPEQKARVYRDHMQSWVIKIMKHANLGGALYGEYKKQDWVSKGKVLSPYELITLLSMEVAPLSMAHWIEILKRLIPLKCLKTDSHLKSIIHANKKSNCRVLHATLLRQRHVMRCIITTNKPVTGKDALLKRTCLSLLIMTSTSCMLPTRFWLDVIQSRLTQESGILQSSRSGIVSMVIRLSCYQTWFSPLDTSRLILWWSVTLIPEKAFVNALRCPKLRVNRNPKRTLKHTGLTSHYSSALSVNQEPCLKRRCPMRRILNGQ